MSPIRQGKYGVASSVSTPGSDIIPRLRLACGWIFRRFPAQSDARVAQVSWPAMQRLLARVAAHSDGADADTGSSTAAAFAACVQWIAQYYAEGPDAARQVHGSRVE